MFRELPGANYIIRGNRAPTLAGPDGAASAFRTYIVTLWRAGFPGESTILEVRSEPDRHEAHRGHAIECPLDRHGAEALTPATEREPGAVESGCEGSIPNGLRPLTIDY